MLAEHQKTPISNVTSPRPCLRQISSQRLQMNGQVAHALEKIYPGIYLTPDLNIHSADELKTYGFTHIIYIDKHINGKNEVNGNGVHTVTVTNQRPPLASANVCGKELLFDGPNFEILDLNFGESAYLTQVLPSCYKAVKFIEKALKNNGAVLVIDPLGNKQKCVTIVVGYLMYRYNKNFLTAYQSLQRFHPNIELDRFFISQLYEYEPILQMQRTQSCGNSCSRELRSALLKRKKSYDNLPTEPSAVLCSDVLLMNIDQPDILME